jgi:hypothetical protein
VNKRLSFSEKSTANFRNAKSENEAFKTFKACKTLDIPNLFSDGLGTNFKFFKKKSEFFRKILKRISEI